jgi:hypothetical protein
MNEVQCRDTLDGIAGAEYSTHSTMKIEKDQCKDLDRLVQIRARDLIIVRECRQYQGIILYEEIEK